MNELHPHQQKIIDLISLEMKEQEHRYKLDGQASLKQLKAEGLVLHPITVTRKSFGYADYPEIAFKLPYSNETNNFKDSVAIECFIEGEESIKGILIGMDGKKGEFRLFAPDFPDWIEDKGVGIKIAPDHRTSENMIGAIKNLSQHPFVFELFKKIHGNYSFTQDLSSTQQIREFRNKSLNTSQQKAVSGMVQNEQLIVLHGPPGTGKTTTLIEGIVQIILQGKRVLVSAPSNAAVDTIAQYKRNFGKDEREQRALLQKEVKSIRKEIRALRDYFDEKLYEQAEVVVGTPIGLSDFLPKNALFDTLVLDEAGQSIEALAWIIFPFAKSWVLAGDPFQLPPTVLSNEAGRNGLSISILEHSFRNCQDVFFLDTQYRMRKSIADFSSNYFYQSKLITPENQLDISQHITFYDTAGTGFEEQTGQNGTSLMNEGELNIIQKLIECEGLDIKKCAVISPYSGQVQLAKDLFSSDTLVSTIDSFQGQENEIIILSLVRSNSDAVIGFLKDYRRMNVALTRAKEQLFVIGDSATIGQDEFYANFLAYVEEVNGYRSAWELLG